ncbi:TPA: hypothetical protein OT922_003776 [Morganella morganii]|nr:hypothetical protein [Morganella morganii]
MMSKLTKEEIKWVAGVQAALNKYSGERIGFYTIGDYDIFLYDSTKYDKICHYMDANSCDFPEAVEVMDAGLGEILNFPGCVHSVAG